LEEVQDYSRVWVEVRVTLPEEFRIPKNPYNCLHLLLSHLGTLMPVEEVKFPQK